jgi:hypothetical protein
MVRYYLAGLILITASLGSSAQSKPADATKGTDPTQSFVSPLGMGTGATVSVTQKGTEVTTAIGGQIIKTPFNLWQLGLSGTTNTNGQATVYSSHQADAPGFKGKFALGHSSMRQKWTKFTLSAGQFRLQAWCRDLLKVIDGGLPTAGAANIPTNVDCGSAIPLEKRALDSSPPVDPITKKPDEKLAGQDEYVLDQLTSILDSLTALQQYKTCSALNSLPIFYAVCPGSGSEKSVEDERKQYPDLYQVISEPSKFQWKLTGAWSPTLTSVAYRPVTNGVADLSSKQNWTQLLSSGVGDIALYYGSLAFGGEAGYGQTVQIKTQNVCNNTTSGTYTAQSCDIAMLGKPDPMNSKLASATLQISPLPILGKTSALSLGAQAIFSYAAPDPGGHSSELAVPFYIAPKASQMSFVVGIQPTWDRNTDPTIGNKFSISVFVGARPQLFKK